MARACRHLPPHTDSPQSRSDEARHVSCLVATPFLVEGESLERRFVTGDKQEDGILVGTVHMLAPGAAGYRERVEFLPVEALAIDDGITLAAERGDEQARRLAQWQGLFARPQHLGEESDGLEDRLARCRIDIFDHQRFIRVAVPIL